MRGMRDGRDTEANTVGDERNPEDDPSMALP